MFINNKLLQVSFIMILNTFTFLHAQELNTTSSSTKKAKVKKESYLRRFLNREPNYKWGIKKIKVLNPLAENCITKKLSDFENQEANELALNNKGTNFEKIDDFCTHFDTIKVDNGQGQDWELIDGIALRLGADCYTWRDMGQYMAAQKFMHENGAGNTVFNVGFSAIKALGDEAKILGLSDSSSMAEEFLDTMRAQWRITESHKFETLFEKHVGCSISNFKTYIQQREIAMSMLHHLCPTRSLTTKDFVKYLKDKNIFAIVKYDIDVAIMQEQEVAAYQDGLLNPNWISFGLREENELCIEIRQELDKLNDDEISAPLFIRDEYWLIKKKETDITVDDKLLLLKEMRDGWIEESIKQVLPKISCGVVKTVLDN